MHSTNSQFPCLTSDLDSTASTAAMAHCYIKILNPKQSVPLPIRFVQIEAFPDETNTTDVLHDLL